MVVCHCRGITDREVRAAIDEGARTLAEVGRQCGAAQRCGGCSYAVTDLLAAAPNGGCPLLARDSDALTVTAAA